jgi:hypothetical protein
MTAIGATSLLAGIMKHGLKPQPPRRSPITSERSSLSRQVSNSGLITHAVTLCSLADDATRGSRFSSRSASGRLMMAFSAALHSGPETDCL